MAEEQVNNQNLQSEQDNISLSNAPEVSTFSPAEAEKLYTKDDVARIVRREVWETKQKNDAQRSGSPGSSLSEDKIREWVADEARKIAEQQEQKRQQELTQKAQQEELERNHKIATNFLSQVDEAASKYSDFDDVVDRDSFLNMTHLIPLMEKTGMSGDILHYLGKNPEIHTQLSTLARENKKVAAKQLDAIANGLKVQESASKVKIPPKPLDHMKQSSVGVGGGQTKEDYTGRDWMRF